MKRLYAEGPPLPTGHCKTVSILRILVVAGGVVALVFWLYLVHYGTQLTTSGRAGAIRQIFLDKIVLK